MPESLSRSSKENIRKLIIMQIFVLRIFFFHPMAFCYQFTWDLPLGLCWCCLPIQNGRRKTIHCLTFLGIDMCLVKIVPPAFMQHSAMASFSVHDPLWQKQVLCRLGWLPNYLCVDGKPERSAELCPLLFELCSKAFSLAALQCQNNISCHRTSPYNVKTRGITCKLKWAYTYSA